MDINDGTALERGVFPALPEGQSELWRTAVNVEFRNRRALKATGFDTQILTGTQVRALAQAFVDGERRFYWAQTGEIYKSADGTPVLIGGPWGSSGYWSLETWGAFLLASDEQNPVQVWKNTGVMVDLAGFTGVRAGRRYKILKKHKNHMLGYFKQRVDWSHESDIEQWVPSTTNSAGGYDLRDLDSDIMAVAPLGDQMAIYSLDKIVVQRYSGEPFYFTFDPAVDGAGAVGEFAVAAASNKNYVMGPKGFYVTDGIGVVGIDNPQINETVYGKVGDNTDSTRFDPSNGRRVVSVVDERNSTVKWWYPCMDGVRRGVSFKYNSGAWGMLVQPVLAAAPHEVFNAPIVGTTDRIGFLQGANFGDGPQESLLETFPYDGGDRDRFKQWDMYEALGKLAGLEIRFGYLDRLREPDGSPTPTEWTAWTPLVGQNWLQPRESVYLRVALRSTGLNVAWEFEGLSVHGEMTALNT